MKTLFLVYCHEKQIYGFVETFHTQTARRLVGVYRFPDDLELPVFQPAQQTDALKFAAAHGEKVFKLFNIDSLTSKTLVEEARQTSYQRFNERLDAKLGLTPDPS